MEFNNIIKLSASIIICELAGIVGSVFTMPAIENWYKGLNKPSLNPPNWIFGPVWTTLFLLMGVSLYLVWNKKWIIKNEIGKSDKKIKPNPLSEKLWNGSWQKINILSIFSVQLMLNVCWSVVFFGLHSIIWSFSVILMLWFAILFTMVNFYRVSKVAAYLLTPYLLWVSFAGFLNYFILLLN